MSLPYRFHAPAKVNLYLHVTGRRDDGYHLLDSLAVFANSASDELAIAPATSDELKIDGPFGDRLSAQDGMNLITRAVDAYREIAGVKTRFRINLTKNLPLGAGIGGGSSDAARTFRALEYIEEKKIDETVRDKALLAIGADIPLCYRDAPCRFRGVGEIITAAPSLPSFHLVLIWPGVHCATKEIFAARPVNYNGAGMELPASFSSAQSLAEFLEKHTRNDLEATASRLHPQIEDAKLFLAQQKGCLLARMSGSGASVFGIFDRRSEAETALRHAAAFGEWWASISSI